MSASSERWVKTASVGHLNRMSFCIVAFKFFFYCDQLWDVLDWDPVDTHMQTQQKFHEAILSLLTCYAFCDNSVVLNYAACSPLISWPVVWQKQFSSGPIKKYQSLLSTWHHARYLGRHEEILNYTSVFSEREELTWEALESNPVRHCKIMPPD